MYETTLNDRLLRYFLLFFLLELLLKVVSGYLGVHGWELNLALGGGQSSLSELTIRALLVI